jgi:hypothetical protein
VDAEAKTAGNKVSVQERLHPFVPSEWERSVGTNAGTGATNQSNAKTMMMTADAAGETTVISEDSPTAVAHWENVVELAYLAATVY